MIGDLLISLIILALVYGFWWLDTPKKWRKLPDPPPPPPSGQPWWPKDVK